jgi:hypothetical protein
MPKLSAALSAAGRSLHDTIFKCFNAGNILKNMLLITPWGRGLGRGTK